MANYLVTGGAGFVGSHLIASLIGKGRGDDLIVSMDNYSTGDIYNHYRYTHCHYRTGDVTDKNDLRNIFCEYDFDAVFHLASAVGVKTIMDKPIQSMESIIEGTKNVLEAVSVQPKKPKLLITSTSEVYGKRAKVPFEESGDVTYGPTTNYRWCYAYAKALDEMMALTFAKERDLEVKIVRLFNTVGPGQSPAYGMVIPRFVQAALEGEPLQVHGDGSQSRCFCHVGDVVLALRKIMDNPACDGEIINIGSDKEISILSLAQRVIELTKSNSKIELIPYEQAYQKGFEDMKRRVPSLEKIKEIVGWEPILSLDKIILDTVRTIQRR